MLEIVQKGMKQIAGKPPGNRSGGQAFDDHRYPHHDVTSYQLALLMIYIVVLFLWILKLPDKILGKSLLWNSAKHSETSHNSIEAQQDSKAEKSIKVDITTECEVTNSKNGEANQSKSKTNVTKGQYSAASPAPTFHEFLQYILIFGLIMVYFFLCDYIKIFPTTPRVYNRDTFLFLLFLLFLVGCGFTLRPTSGKILNRDQTEEWKGWMQVMFVWYHYFAAKEWYNWIRIYIACYVWMTGFGNFSFFWVRKDYSLWRVLKMLFRLNFLVIFVAMVTSNEYMLYYICAMHTYWFISVYLFMGVMRSWNGNRLKMAIKFAVYILCNAMLFEIPGVISTVFRPLRFIFGFHDSRFDIMHEWEFRAGLDHWVCLVGMLCAYNYPHFEEFMSYLESESSCSREMFSKLALKMSAVLTAVLAGTVWYRGVMWKDKYAYNRLHPYTSPIPILVFIVLRNSFRVLRKYYVHMFAWLGKITLETYLSQLHIYLQSNAKDLIGYLPNYSLLNASLSTFIYLSFSYVLFQLTTEFSSFLFPKDMKLILKNCITGAIVFAVCLALAFGFETYLA